MYPNIKPRSFVDVKRSKPCFGDVGVFKSGKRLVAHRVLARFFTPKGEYYLTKGDNNPCFDFPRHAKTLQGVVERKYSSKWLAITSLIKGTAMLPWCFLRKLWRHSKILNR